MLYLFLSICFICAWIKSSSPCFYNHINSKKSCDPLKEHNDNYNSLFDSLENKNNNIAIICNKISDQNHNKELDDLHKCYKKASIIDLTGGSELEKYNGDNFYTSGETNYRTILKLKEMIKN